MVPCARKYRVIISWFLDAKEIKIKMVEALKSSQDIGDTND
jgi:hypothetical protein